jgi:hypothetical protein
MKRCGGGSSYTGNGSARCYGNFLVDNGSVVELRRAYNPTPEGVYDTSSPPFDCKPLSYSNTLSIIWQKITCTGVS